MNSDPRFSLKQGGVSLEALTARIRTAFPDLAFADAVLNDEGDDHAVVILDRRWVFRFPRSAEAASYAAGERRLLATLARAVTLAIPAYEFVSPGGDFGGYRMIEGEPLSEARFAALAPAVQDRLMDEIGDFLRAVHALPPVLASANRRTRLAHQTAAEHVRGVEDRRPILAGGLSLAVLARIDGFYAAFPAAVDGAARRTLIHADFTEDHILLAPDGERLAGVIDFTDAGLGDPAYDFTFLWAYGEPAARRAAQRHGADDDLLLRSRWRFASYRINQIYWSLSGARAYDVARIAAELPPLFDKLGV
jgi:aminoglycoside 2''-phosphotransferase